MTLLNGPSMAKGVCGGEMERDLQNINLMCYIHAKREKLFYGTTKYDFHLCADDDVFM